MKKKNKNSKTAKDLESLANIGPATARRLYAIGITTASQLKKSNPEKVYEKLRKQEGGILDRCVLSSKMRENRIFNDVRDERD